MNTGVSIHGSWKTKSKDKNDLTFFSINVNSLAHWSRESNKVERLKHIFKKVQHRRRRVAGSVHELGTITPVIDTSANASKNSGEHTFGGIIQ